MNKLQKIKEKSFTIEELPIILSGILSDIEALKNPDDKKDLLMNINESVEYMGISQAEFRNLRKIKAVEPVKFPGSPKFSRNELDDFMKECKNR